MAVIRFNFQGTMGLRVLEKEGGQWKLIESAGVYKDGYDMANMLNNMEGTWKFDESSFKIEGIPGKIVGLKAQIEKTGSKLRLVKNISWKNGQGQVNEAAQTFDIIPRIGQSAAHITYTWAWANGTASAASGVFKMGKDKFSGALTELGEENPWGNVSLDFSESSRLRFHFQVLNEKGEETWNMSYDLVKE